MGNLCFGVNYMWWENQYLVSHEWDNFINSKDTIILAIIMLVPCKNPPGYKQNVNNSIEFDLGEGVIIIYWIENIKLCFSKIVKPYKNRTICY